jgi:hypothetical protein
MSWPEARPGRRTGSSFPTTYWKSSMDPDGSSSPPCTLPDFARRWRRPLAPIKRRHRNRLRLPLTNRLRLETLDVVNCSVLIDKHRYFILVPFLYHKPASHGMFSKPTPVHAIRTEVSRVYPHCLYRYLHSKLRAL